MTYASGILLTVAEREARRHGRPVGGPEGQDVPDDVDLRLALAIRSEQYRAALGATQHVVPTSLIDFIS